MKNSIPRITTAGLAGGLTMTLAILLIFRLVGFGWAAGTVFIDTSAKVQQNIAEWITIEPIPLMIVNPKPFIIGLLLFSMIHAWVYVWLSPSWPPGIMRRGGRLALLVFGLSFVSWEFFGAFNFLGISANFIGIQMILWGIASLTEGLVIASVMELNGKQRFPSVGVQPPHAPEPAINV